MSAAASRKPDVFIGTAGWSLRGSEAAHFPESGTHLQRYAAVFRAAEINSSFYRPHRPQLYAKWAADVPDGFRFSVKIPKLITHEQRFENTHKAVDAFCLEVAGLGKKLGCLLVQLPPSFEFDAKLSAAFFKHLRSRVACDIACEPRNPTWFEDEADALLQEFRVTRAAADPARVPAAASPGGFRGCQYYRLHGSPRMYYSSYTSAYLKRLARDISKSHDAERVWCVFDNTASSAAVTNALTLQKLLADK